MKFNISSFLENINYKFKRKNILSHLPEKFIDDAVNAIPEWDTYEITSLKNLDHLEKNLILIIFSIKMKVKD